ncbi:MAG TPA: acetate/propionate family kinase [Acidimicrobiales bacterium]|nr:acetate/propionate family kinase [Acidimicrobiales bacterium]
MARLTTVLAVNAGSTTLKLSVVTPQEAVTAATTVDPWDGDEGPVAGFLEEVGGIAAIGAVAHRVVHGGPEGSGPELVDEDVVARIAGLTPLAPLHQSRALAAVRAVARIAPDVPAVACYDTAYHATLPEAARAYAVPEEWVRRWGLRRYGFHGLSHAHAARRAAEMTGAGDVRVVSAHLGSGASLCASHSGRSVDTTMGFTPLEGLVMATRSGTVDPGLVLWLWRQGLGVDEVTRGLEGEGGLAALAGRGGDMRLVVEAAGAGDDRAALAVDVWLHRLVREAGAMAAVLGGVDAFVFTGGIGEHQPGLRSAVAARLSHLGLDLDEAANRSGTGDRDLSTRSARCRMLVVEAHEDLEMARQARALLAGPGEDGVS